MISKENFRKYLEAKYGVEAVEEQNMVERFYEVEKQFDFYVNGKKICSHQPDFFITGKDGRQWVEEYKGFASPVWPIKKKLFEALYPQYEYKVIRHK